MPQDDTGLCSLQGGGWKRLALAGDSHSGKGAVSAGKCSSCQEGFGGIRSTHSLAWAAVTDSFDGTHGGRFSPF